MDRHSSSRFSSRDDSGGDRRSRNPGRDRSPGRGHSSHGHSRSPGRRRSPGRGGSGRSPGRGRSPPGRARSPRGRLSRGRSPMRDRSPRRNRSPRPSRNEFEDGPSGPPDFGAPRPLMGGHDGFRSGPYDERRMDQSSGFPYPPPSGPGPMGPYTRRDEPLRMSDHRQMSPDTGRQMPPPDMVRQMPPDLGRQMPQPDMVRQMPQDLGRQMPPDIVSKLPIVDPNVPVPHCELIITDVNGRQRMYGESVKLRLASSGLSTELVFMRDPNAIGPAVQDAVRRRILFACIINEQNESHRSMTVNILHGQLQEHRNMPLDNAISLVIRSFEDWSNSGDGAGGRNPLTAGSMPLPPGAIGRPPASGVRSLLELNTVPAKHPATPEFKRPNENMTRMMKMVIDGKFLVVEELDEIIGYLQERRDQLAKDRGIQPITKPTPDTSHDATNDVEEQRRDLQEKIRKMLEEDPSLAKAAKGMLEKSGVDLQSRIGQIPPQAPQQQEHRELSQKSFLGSYGNEDPSAPSWNRPPPDPREVLYGTRQFDQSYEPGPSQPPPHHNLPTHHNQPGPSSEYFGSSAGNDFRGLQDKIRTLFPGMSSSASGTKTSEAPPTAQQQSQHQYQLSSQKQVSSYAAPPAVVTNTNYRQEWGGGSGDPMPSARQDWRAVTPGYGAPVAPPPLMPQRQNFREPPPAQQFGGNYRPEGRQFSRFN